MMTKAVNNCEQKKKHHFIIGLSTDRLLNLNFKQEKYTNMEKNNNLIKNEEKDEPKYLIIEGEIGAGKTTLTKEIENYCKNKGKIVQVLPELVDEVADELSDYY